MTEIDGKKYYTWQEILAMPLGTNFKILEYLISFRRNDFLGVVELYMNGYVVNFGDWSSLILQDRFEIVEDKPERDYVTGIQALKPRFCPQCKDEVETMNSVYQTDCGSCLEVMRCNSCDDYHFKNHCLTEDNGEVKKRQEILKLPLIQGEIDHDLHPPYKNHKIGRYACGCAFHPTLGFLACKKFYAWNQS